MPSNNDEHDIVSNPKHYQLLPGVQVIDVRDVLLDKMDGVYTPRQVDCWSRSWEYLTRFASKNGLEDLKKSRWYLDRLIADLEKTEPPVVGRDPLRTPDHSAIPERREPLPVGEMRHKERQEIRDKLKKLRHIDEEHSASYRA